MSPLRTLAVLVVFLALGSIELFNGLSRIATLREERRGELLEIVERGHLDLARRLRVMLEVGRSQTDYLARLPALAAYLERLDAADPAAAGAGVDAAAPAEVGAFLASFEGLQCVVLVDRAGSMRLALERGADGGAPAASAVDADAVRSATRTGLLVAGFDPLLDAAPPLLAARPVQPRPASAGSAGSPGWVVVGLAPRPFVEAVAGFRPLGHTASRIVTGDAVPDAAPGGPGRLVPARRTATGLALATPLTDEPPLTLVTDVPDRAVEAAMTPLRRQYAWIVFSMVGVTLALGLVGVVVLRLSQRAFRLRETEHYLRWIRRVTDRYRALMEGAADMILIVGPDDGVVREANAAARQVFGLGAREVQPLEDGVEPHGAAPAPERLASLLSDSDQARVEEGLREAAGSPGRPVAVPGLDVRAADGRRLVVDGHLALVDLGHERVVEVSLRDVTRQRATERQLQTVERLGSLGLLTAGVAHEINNPLEGIGNYLSLLSRPDLDEERRARYIDRVRTGFARIRDIVQDLLSFARPSVDSGRADLREVVGNALDMAAYSQVFAAVTVERVGLAEPLVVSGDARRLEQVLLNLLLNAARAMAGRGRVRIEGRRRAGADGAEWVELSVADDGPGIPPGDVDRIFDPFFSGHGGTGLGLAVSFGIVKAHGGVLRAHNDPRGGAVFTIELPAHDGTSETAPARAEGVEA